MKCFFIGLKLKILTIETTKQVFHFEFGVFNKSNEQ